MSESLFENIIKLHEYIESSSYIPCIQCKVASYFSNRQACSESRGLKKNNTKIASQINKKLGEALFFSALQGPTPSAKGVVKCDTEVEFDGV